jgi:hypothetical protein
MFSSTVTWSTRQFGVQTKLGVRPDDGVTVTAPLHGARLGPLELVHRANPPTTSTSAACCQMRKLTIGFRQVFPACGLTDRA